MIPKIEWETSLQIQQILERKCIEDNLKNLKIQMGYKHFQKNITCQNKTVQKEIGKQKVLALLSGFSN